MVIPSLVVLLIWKSFFDPTVGILNILLNRTGMMKVLHWLDSTMPAAAGWLEPVLQHGVAPAFGNAWGLALVGVMALLLVQGWRGLRAHAGWWILLAGAGLLLWGPLRGALTIVITITCGVLLGLTPRGSSTARGTGIGALVAAAGLLLLGTIWTEPTEAFRHGSPAWLGDSRLVIPAVILWGFPWIGTVGVLIYLAGLQNISQDVYEAAELDGLGAFGKMFRIELPLIMTQVRINLVFMTIGTLGEYVFFMVLLGADGGPRNVGMVPGLYMYREAFINTRFGYSCALGVVLFALLLAITVLFQRYVRVEK
ncbi:MAG: hypothetical protein CMJ18_20545 [Phycisphaeraceae bacterium]|nr:hypothetical protein [Phycisphaeraceae bacterium]